MTQLLKKEEDEYICNNVHYQSKASKVNTCGSYVVHRLYKPNQDNMSLPDYHQFMKHHGPDERTNDLTMVYRR